MDSLAEKQALQARAAQLQKQNQQCIQQRLLLLASLVKIVNEQSNLKKYARLNRDDEIRLIKQQQQVQQLIQNIESIQTQIQLLNEQNQLIQQENQSMRTNLQIGLIAFSQKTKDPNQIKVEHNNSSVLKLAKQAQKLKSNDTQNKVQYKMVVNQQHEYKYQVIQQLRTLHEAAIQQKQAKIRQLRNYLQDIAYAGKQLPYIKISEIKRQLNSNNKDLIVAIDIQNRKRQLRKAQLRQIQSELFVINCRSHNRADSTNLQELATKKTEYQKWKQQSNEQINNLRQHSARLANILLTIKQNIKSSKQLLQISGNSSAGNLQNSAINQYHELILLKQKIERLSSFCSSSDNKLIVKRAKRLDRENQKLRKHIKQLAISNQIIANQVKPRYANAQQNIHIGKYSIKRVPLSVQFSEIASNLKVEIKEGKQKLNQIQNKCHEIFKRAEKQKHMIVQAQKQKEAPLKLRLMKQQVDRLRLKSRQKLKVPVISKQGSIQQFKQYDLSKLNQKLARFKKTDKQQNFDELHQNEQQAISRFSSKRTEDFLQKLEFMKQSNRQLRKFIELNQNKQ